MTLGVREGACCLQCSPVDRPPYPPLDRLQLADGFVRSMQPCSGACSCLMATSVLLPLMIYRCAVAQMERDRGTVRTHPGLTFYSTSPSGYARTPVISDSVRIGNGGCL